MTVKYHCRKCGKRFIDWGAEKLGFKCPDCDGEELVRVGSPDDKAAKRPSLKRKPRRIVAPPLPIDDEENLSGIDALEVVPLEEEGIFPSDDDEVEEEAEFVDEVLPVVADGAEDAEVIDEGAGFVEVTPPLGDDIEDAITPESEDEWPA